MNIKTLNVFYGADFLPYKDKERQVHYPNVGSDFQGAENITSIRFYIDEISSNNTTFAVAIELPDGKIGSEVLSPAQYDSEIGEYYVTLAIDRFITQKVGNVSISLRGYQGDIELEYDDDSQLYVLVGGTPITAVTGAIKLRVNQEPQALQGEIDEEVTFQQLLSLIATKLNVTDGIVILGDISTANLSGYEVGQIFYDNDTHTYYEKTDTSPYYTKALSGAGVLGAPNILCRSDDTTRTIAQLHSIYGDSKYIVLRYLDKDYLYFSKKVGSTYTCVAFDTEEQRFYKASGLSGSSLPSAILVPANKIEIASKAFLSSNYVPYSGANSDINLGGHFINNAKTENTYLNHKEDEDNISSVKFVLGNALNLDEVSDIGEGEYAYLLKPNSTILFSDDIYKHITDTQTDLVYAYFNGSVTTQTDGTSLHLGDIIKISKTEVGGVHQYDRESVDTDLYSKDQAKDKFGTSLALELNNTNYKLVAKLYNANGGLIDTSNAIDFPLESIVSSATYYDTYTYEGVTYTKVIVITLSTTSVPTIVPVGDLISGLEKEACVEISTASGTFTEEQMSILALDNASIKFNGRIFHKVTNSYFNSVSVIAEQEQGQYINFVVENKILITPSTRAYQFVEKTIQVYNKDEIDTIVQGLQDGIDTNAHDIDTLEGDIDDIDERLDNHDTEIAKLKKDVDYALKYPLLYGTPTTDTEEEVGLTTSQLPATTLPKGLINYVGGMSQKVNQLCPNLANVTDIIGGLNRTISNNKITLNGTCTSPVFETFSSFNALQNHKYLLLTNCQGTTQSGSVWQLYINGNPFGDYYAINNAILTANSSDVCYLKVAVYPSAQINVSFYAMAVDLTDIYGAGNEPTSTDDIRIKWLIHYLTENPEYDEGSIVNAPVEKLSSKGFNIWDEEWGYGELVSGTFNSKNPIPVLPDTTYYLKCPNNAGVRCLDENQQLIGGISVNANSTFVTLSGTYYIMFYLSGYGSTHNHDICINLSGTMNGTYLPYQAPSEHPIPAEVRNLDGYGLGYDDTLYNYTDFERKKFVKKVGKEQLSNLTFTSSVYSGNTYYSARADNNYASNSDAVIIGVCSAYRVSNVQDLPSDGDITFSSSYRGSGYTIMIRDDSISSVSELIQKLLNKGEVVFKLKTPTETDISEYLDRDFPNENLIDTYQGGEVEFENENDMGVPYSFTYQYKVE